MSKTKKQQPSRAKSPSSEKEAPAQIDLPTPNPPKKNLPLLILSIVLCVLWLSALLAIAFLS